MAALAEELQNIANQNSVDLELMVITDSEKWRDDFERLGVKYKKIISPKLRPVQGGKLKFLEFFKIPITLIQSLWEIFLFMPDLAFTKGGYASVMPSAVSLIYFIPIFIHESDSVPGSANRFISKFAKRIFISFDDAFKYFQEKEVFSVGNPVRKELLRGDKNAAAGIFTLSLDKKTILVIGGSQGAAVINNAVIESLVRLAGKYQIIHQTGLNNFEAVSAETEKIKSESPQIGKNIESNYRLYPFLNEDELKNAYALADIVVSRAGANVIFEIAALGKPAVVIPYKYSANEHQKINAQEFSRFGAVVIEEENLKTNILIDQLEHILEPENYKSISGKIRQFAKPDAGYQIAASIFEYFTSKTK